jgi:hypothetical protein
MKVILSVTWWSLFRAYLMKVILNVSDEGYCVSAITFIRYAQNNLHQIRSK